MTTANILTERWGGIPANQLRPEKQQEIARLLASGMSLTAAAKRAGVGKTTVRNLAQKLGLEVAANRGGRPAKASTYCAPAVTVTVIASTERQDTNWRGRAASLRWGGGLGA